MSPRGVFGTHVEGRAIREEDVDPELRRQLEEADRRSAGQKKAVRAVFMLSAVKQSPESVTPETTRAMVDRIVDTARKATGEDVMRINVFANLGSFVVEAPPQLVRRLIDDPRIASARANAAPPPRSRKR